ncbi:hypothetical protein CC117_28740 [Parafrankia colletiae]|uniref:Winged helix DNA-binding domain-containing protein n=1 Tax=Parafrankia colletiae TaxID=573497 RepID=A0A1S1Q9B0_9ACTN|nr:hypothetical protein CC117_28740 [Parafrankia colletiae]
MAARRLRAQGLTDRGAPRVVDVVERLLAVQAQDGRGMRLAVRSRTDGLHASDVDDALSVDRSIVVTWLNRGTLHLVRSQDYWWLHALTAPRMAAQIRRRLAQEGLTAAEADHGVTVVERALAGEGPLVRARLKERLDAAGVRTERQALVYIMVLASSRGLVVRGPVVDGGEQAFVLVRDWLGGPPAVDRDTALAELVGRYLAGHGPATPADTARWAGLPVGDIRRGLTAAGDHLIDLGNSLIDLRERSGPAGRLSAAPAPAPALPAPRLLGSFDPVLHGWVSRDWIVGGHQSVVTTNGIFRPIALVDGKAVATWAMPGGTVELTPFAPLSDEVTASLRADAADVRRFLGR